jgi:hypothetical protein
MTKREKKSNEEPEDFTAIYQLMAAEGRFGKEALECGGPGDSDSKPGAEEAATKHARCGVRKQAQRVMCFVDCVPDHALSPSSNAHFRGSKLNTLPIHERTLGTDDLARVIPLQHAIFSPTNPIETGIGDIPALHSMCLGTLPTLSTLTYG